MDKKKKIGVGLVILSLFTFGSAYFIYDSSKTEYQEKFYQSEYEKSFCDSLDKAHKNIRSMVEYVVDATQSGSHYEYVNKNFHFITFSHPYYNNSLAEQKKLRKEAIDDYIKQLPVALRSEPLEKRFAELYFDILFPPIEGGDHYWYDKDMNIELQDYAQNYKRVCGSNFLGEKNDLDNLNIEFFSSDNKMSVKIDEDYPYKRFKSKKPVIINFSLNKESSKEVSLKINQFQSDGLDFAQLYNSVDEVSGTGYFGKLLTSIKGCFTKKILNDQYNWDQISYYINRRLDQIEIFNGGFKVSLNRRGIEPRTLFFAQITKESNIYNNPDMTGELDYTLTTGYHYYVLAQNDNMLLIKDDSDISGWIEKSHVKIIK